MYQASSSASAPTPKPKVGGHAVTALPEVRSLEQRKQVKLRFRALLRNHRIVCPHSPWTIKGKAWLLDETNIPSTIAQDIKSIESYLK